MIKASKAKESRQRDQKRNRILLTVGTRSWHVTQTEAKSLLKQLARLVK
jgi:hypothetical protein